MSRTRTRPIWPLAENGTPAEPIGPDSPLTTKEGWRRFVEHEQTAPDLLDPAALTALTRAQRARYDQLRREYHAHLPLVDTPTIKKVVSTARLLIQLNRGQISARRGVIVSGASGTGKTSALSQLGLAHELASRRRHPDQPHHLPVIYVTVPPAATARMLAVEFGRFFGLEIPARSNITDVTNAVCALAAHAGVELVCVDELHNISPASRASAEVSDQLKYFAERLPATFVFAGIEIESQGLLGGVRGRQMAGRFTVIPARPFDYGTAPQRQTWCSLIATMESQLRLHQHRPDTLTGQAEHLYQRTGGAIGSLSQLVRGAAVLAIEEGTEKITKKLLEAVPVDYAAEHPALPAAPRAGRRRKAAA